MNASSQLTYPAFFRDSLRQVQLSGQAFFEVARDTARPFEIQSSGYVTSVLGTAFDLKAYAGEPASLLVREGKVRFSTSSESVFLTKVEVRDPEIAAHLYKGKFQNPSSKALLDDISYVMNFRYEIHGNTVVIY